MNNFENSYKNKRIIALWAFSESVLGGMLHLFKIPLTGLVLGGLAVIFLSLIAYQSSNKLSILKATLIVLIIKFVISPYTPIMAFVSVSVEGLLCYLFCIIFGKKSIGIYIFALSSMIFFSIQKLITLQILFGNSLWDSIDAFSLFISKQFGLTDLKISALLITIYISLHIIAGLIFSYLSVKLIKDLESLSYSSDGKVFINAGNEKFETFNRKSKKRIIKKVITLFLLAAFIGFSYLLDGEKGLYGYMLTVVRFISIIIIWLFFVSPFLSKIVGKYLTKKHKKYNNEVGEILNSFPHIKKISYEVWNELKGRRGILKYFTFVHKAIINFIIY
ncbi:MAG: hypothetical protein V1773_05720 [bacterium]